MRTVNPASIVTAVSCVEGVEQHMTESTSATPFISACATMISTTTMETERVQGVKNEIAAVCESRVDDDDLHASRLRSLLGGSCRSFCEWNWSEAVNFKRTQERPEVELSAFKTSDKASGNGSSSSPHSTAATASIAPSLETRGDSAISPPAPMCGCTLNESSCEVPRSIGNVCPSEADTSAGKDPLVQASTPLLDNYTIPISRQGPEYFSSATQPNRTSLCIIMVGLPARGKTFLAQKICRLLGWHGWRAKVLNVQAAWRRLLLQYKNRLLGEEHLVTSSASVNVASTKFNLYSPNRNSEMADAAATSSEFAMGTQAMYEDGTTTPHMVQRPSPKTDFRQEKHRCQQEQEQEQEQQQRQQQQNLSYINAENFRSLMNDPNSIERRLYRHVLEHYARDASHFYADGGDVLVVNDDFLTEDLRDEAEVLFFPLASQNFFMEVIRDDALSQIFNEMKVKDSMEYPSDVNMDEATLDFLRRVEYLQDMYTTLSSASSSDGASKDDAAHDAQTSTGRRSKRYIKLINSMEVEVHGVKGYTASRILSYVMNVTQLKVQHPIYFFRHGESLYNLEDRIGGDSELSPDGEKGANEFLGFVASLKEYYAAEKAKRGTSRDKHDGPNGFGCGSYSRQHGETDMCGSHDVVEVWTSQLRRAVQTVEHVEQLLGVKTLRWNNLNEIHAGICEDLTYEEVQTHYPLIDQFRKSNKYSFRYPEGESYQDLVMRLEPVIMELENTDRVVVVVAHQAVLRALLAYFGSTSAESCVRLEVPHRTVWRCQYNSKGIASLDELRFEQQ